jgi:hypothetical protein
MREKNQQTHQLFIQFINYHGSSYIFWHYIAIFRSVPRAFWEMLNWGAVDRMLWMGVLCLVS